MVLNMKSRRLHRMLLVLLIFIAFNSSSLSNLAVSFHTCCYSTYEYSCSPCLYFNKLRGTAQHGLLPAIPHDFAFLLLLILVVVSAFLSHSSPNLVGLKVRMNN